MQNAAQKGAALELQFGDLDTHSTSISTSLLQTFELRCWARARLYAEGLLSLHEAVDKLAADADHNGIEPDVAQDLMAAEFSMVRG